jgi:prepilin-type processing-associated H-X9-DG protein
MPYAAPMQGQQSNGLALAGLICSIAGLFTCGLAGIAGLICSILGLKKSNEIGTGRGMAIAGIVIGAFSLLFVPALLASIMLPSLARAREKANEVKCAANLRQIGQAIVMYANDNKGYAPPDFSYLPQYLAGTTVYTCPSSSAPATTSGSVSTDYIYVVRPGQKLMTQKYAAQSVLVYEPLSDHPGDGANFLFFDGHVQFLGKKEAAAMIKQLEQGNNPPTLNGLPSGPEQ